MAVASGVALLLLVGCQTAERKSVAASGASALPRSAMPETSVRHEIRGDLSAIRFLVFRAGPLARLGHNHVVEAKNIRGDVWLAADIQQSSFFIELAVKDFDLDAEAARAEEGDEFFPQPDDEAIAGTRKNMFGEKVLDAARFPTIEIRSLALSGPAWGMDVALRIGMHGVERDMVVPTAVDVSGDTIVATAFFSIDQSDFGITPLSVLGGALQVANTVKVRMRVVAKKGS
jgi:hypothetical protein